MIFAQRSMATSDFLSLEAQDSSPRNWDNRYFSEFQDDQPPQGVARFESDINLADPGTVCGQAFVKFAADSGKSNAMRAIDLT